MDSANGARRVAGFVRPRCGDASRVSARKRWRIGNRTRKGGLRMAKRAKAKSKKEAVKIGIIGGSGLYSMGGLTNTREVRVETPFGDPSDAIVIGTLEGRRVAFLARHGW